MPKHNTFFKLHNNTQCILFLIHYGYSVPARVHHFEQLSGALCDFMRTQYAPLCFRTK